MSVTRAMTKQIRIQQWTEIFKDKAASGLKVKEYCQLHGITKDAYFYWLKKVREATIESSGIELVKLKEPASLPPSVIFGADTVFKIEATISSGNFTISGVWGDFFKYMHIRYFFLLTLIQKVITAK